MLVLSLLLITKSMLFVLATNVEHDVLLVLFLTSAISIFVISLIGMSKMEDRKKKIWLSSFYSVVSLVMLIDIMHYSYFGSLPSVKMLSQAGQLTDVKTSVTSLLTLRNLLFVLDLPLTIYYLFKSELEDVSKLNKRVRISVPVSILAVTVGVFGYLSYIDNIKSIELQEMYSFHFNDIKDTLVGEPDEILAENTVFSQEDLEEYEERRKMIEGEYTGIGKDRNLIVIQVEALQNFVVGLEYNGQEITPNINKLVEDSSSIYYDNYFQLVGRGNTSDAEFVTNNSLHPSMETPTYDQYEDNTYYGLPWLLRDNDYSVWAFHGYKREFWNRENAYPHQGYERFLAEDDFDFDEEKDVIGMGISDEKFFEQTLDYLKELNRVDDNPFYAFVVSLTSHNPFDMPEEYHVLDIEKKYEDTILGDYLQSIHYTDKYIGEFIEGLKEEGLYDNSVIALYGDHFAIQNSSQEVVDTMSDFLGRDYYYDDIMNIPLIITVPGEDIKHTNSRVGSQLDFYPTIINILGLENEKGIMFGRDLNHYEGYHNVTPQTMLRKGSFIDDEIIFEVSRTEIFDHSKAMDKFTREPINIGGYREIYDNNIREINQSNFILKNDLLKHYIENNGVLDLGDLELDDLEKINRIYKDKIRNLEDLEEIFYMKRNSFVVDMTFKDDGNIFINDKLMYEDFLEWLEENENKKHHMYIKYNIDDRNDTLKRLQFLYPESKSDYIIEIDNFEEHYFVTQFGYENIMLDLTDADYTDKELLDFIQVHSLYGVIYKINDIDDSMVKKLNSMGISVYIEESESINLYK